MAKSKKRKNYISERPDHPDYFEEPSVGGRPLIYQSKEELREHIERHFQECADNSVPVTVTGLALFLGFNSRKTLYNYAERPQFLHTLKRALLMVENAYESKLHADKCTGPIFALKNMGWDAEKHEKTEVVQKIDLSKYSTDELLKLANELNEDQTQDGD